MIHPLLCERTRCLVSVVKFVNCQLQYENLEFADRLNLETGYEKSFNLRYI